MQNKLQMTEENIFTFYIVNLLMIVHTLNPSASDYLNMSLKYNFVNTYTVHKPYIIPVKKSPFKNVLLDITITSTPPTSFSLPPPPCKLLNEEDTYPRPKGLFIITLFCVMNIKTIFVGL